MFKKVYNILLDYYGAQHWWPGETRMEIIVGAILTQNTNWKSVEKALNNLKNNSLLSVEALIDISVDDLARLIRPAGYFNVKAIRLKNFLKFLRDEYRGDLTRMADESTELLRQKLLAVNGIGPETADSILLYAFQRPVFVVDAYTKRVFARHHLIPEDIDYYGLQDEFIRNLDLNEKVFNEYHALIVRLAKDFCKVKSDCESCPLKVLFD